MAPFTGAVKLFRVNMNNVTDFFFDERTFVTGRLRSDEIRGCQSLFQSCTSAERDAQFPKDLFKMTILLAFLRSLGAFAIS